MGQVKLGDKVKIDFIGKIESGEVFVTTKNNEPFELEIGSGLLFKKFEEAILGMQSGNTKSVEIRAQDGFGLHDDSLIIATPKESLPKEVIPQVGLKYKARDPNGETVNLTIVDIDKTTITFDANHPLAGETLFFEIELLEII